MRINYVQQVIYFLTYVVLQLPVLNRFVLENVAFSLFYVGFLLFLPLRTSRIAELFIGFLVGLLIDIFSNTPGLHSMSCLLLVFLRQWWIRVTLGFPEDDQELSLSQLGIRNTFFYCGPLILVHHLLIFSIEHGSLSQVSSILQRTFFSALFNFSIIVVFNIFTTLKRRIL